MVPSQLEIYHFKNWKAVQAGAANWSETATSFRNVHECIKMYHILGHMGKTKDS